MRNNLIRSVAFVDRGLENLYALPRNFRAPQPPDQLLAFSGKHWADHDFDPAHIALDDVHWLLLAKFPPLLTPICSHLLSRSGRCMVHLRVIKRSKGRDHSYPKCLRPANQAARKHAPSALGVANSYRPREAIDGRGEFHSVLQNLSRQGVRDLDPARSSVMRVAAIRYVGPALQQDPPLAFLLDDVQPALQPDKISPRFGLLGRQVHQCFDPLPRSLHQFRSICWRVTHAAVDLDAYHLELPAGGEHGGKIPDRLAHRHKLRPPRTAHRDYYFPHVEAKPCRGDCSGNGTRTTPSKRQGGRRSRALTGKFTSPAPQAV